MIFKEFSGEKSVEFITKSGKKYSRKGKKTKKLPAVGSIDSRQ